MIADCSSADAKGRGIDAGVADHTVEIELIRGYSRYRDPVTHSLGLLASTWDSLHRTWQATEKRAAYGSPKLQTYLATYSETLREMRDKVGARMTAELKTHALWPWLQKYPGVRGVHTARLISMIGDPLRFPGKVCAARHHVSEDWPSPLCPCPALRGEEWGVCNAEVGAVRQGTGVRALWHYVGLHVVDGKSAKKKRGVQCTWNTAARTALMQPDGIADQIIKHRVEPWRSAYDGVKERIAKERGVHVGVEIEGANGSAPSHVGNGQAENAPGIGEIAGLASNTIERENVVCSEIDNPTVLSLDSDNGAEKGAEIYFERDTESGSPLRPIQIHKIARTVAVKAFAGDLLMAWKAAVVVQSQ